MPAFKYTTNVAVTRTISEIQEVLASHGASSIATDYEGGKPCGLSFTVPTPHGPRYFSLAVDVPALQHLLKNQKEGRDGHSRHPSIDARTEQAERVAWRVVFEWLRSQMAMIEAQLATLDQVMLPYLKVDDDHTLYESYKINEQRALEAGN